jgi:hypothetical protein
MTSDARPVASDPPPSRRSTQPVRLHVLGEPVEPKDAAPLPASVALPGDGAPKKVKVVSLGCVENALAVARYQRLLELEQRQPESACS